MAQSEQAPLSDTKLTATPDPDALKRVESLLGDEGLEQVFSPIQQPSGLPNTAFWSPDWLRLEQERIFRRNWVYVAADEELKEPGAIKSLEIGGTPIFLARGQDYKVRAFHNVCRHRGTQLVVGSCKKKAITCPYHAWTYDLQGRLRARPHFQGADKKESLSQTDSESLGLFGIRCETWNGCHFVDLSGKAPSLNRWLAPVFERSSAHDFSQIRWIGKKTYHFKSNWKLVLENYMEGYHVFAAHPRLIAHAPMTVRWSGEWIGHVFYNDYIAPELTAGRGTALPHFPGLSDEDTKRGLWFACLPNFAVQVFADQFVVLATYPTAPDETLEELHFFVAGEEAATNERYATGREELLDMWHKLNMEDVELVERLQQGRRSTAFKGSMMSPAWEGPAHQLAQMIVNSIVTK